MNIINSHFGITQMPFTNNDKELLAHQKEILQALRAHSFQRGFCLVAGDPGTGKSVLTDAFADNNPKQLTPQISRTMHTYSNTLRILCEALQIQYQGGDLKCEQQVIQEAFRLNQIGKAIALMIDDAHLLELGHLRKLRLLFEEMPGNYASILLAHTEILGKLALTVNADLHSRISYSAIIDKLTPEDIETFILDQCERCGLAHNRIDTPALKLIANSSQGILRHAANLTLSSLIQAVRTHQTAVKTTHVNTALMQPHWRDSDHWITQ